MSRPLLLIVAFFYISGPETEAQEERPAHRPASPALADQPQSEFAKLLDHYLNNPSSPFVRKRQLAEAFEAAITSGDVDQGRTAFRAFSEIRLDSRSDLGQSSVERAMEVRLNQLQIQKWLELEGLPLIEEAKQLCAADDTPIEVLEELQDRVKAVERSHGSDIQEIRTLNTDLYGWLEVRRALVSGNKSAVLGAVESLRQRPVPNKLVPDGVLERVLLEASQMKDPITAMLETIGGPEDLARVISRISVIPRGRFDRDHSTLNSQLGTLEGIRTDIEFGRFESAAGALASFSETNVHPTVLNLHEQLRMELFSAVFAKRELLPEKDENSLKFAERALSEVILREAGIEETQRILTEINAGTQRSKSAAWLASEARLLEDILSASRTEEAGDIVFAINRYRSALSGSNSSRIGLIQLAGDRLGKLVEKNPELAAASEAVILRELEALRAEISLLRRSSTQRR